MLWKGINRSRNRLFENLALCMVEVVIEFWDLAEDLVGSQAQDFLVVNSHAGVHREVVEVGSECIVEYEVSKDDIVVEADIAEGLEKVFLRLL